MDDLGGLENHITTKHLIRRTWHDWMKQWREKNDYRHQKELRFSCTGVFCCIWTSLENFAEHGHTQMDAWIAPTRCKAQHSLNCCDWRLRWQIVKSLLSVNLLQTLLTLPLSLNNKNQSNSNFSPSYSILSSAQKSFTFDQESSFKHNTCIFLNLFQCDWKLNI